MQRSECRWQLFERDTIRSDGVIKLGNHNRMNGRKYSLAIIMILAWATSRLSYSDTYTSRRFCQIKLPCCVYFKLAVFILSFRSCNNCEQVDLLHSVCNCMYSVFCRSKIDIWCCA